ncbi:hypothetical protein FF1_031767 [Malus domestica]
MYRVLVPLFTIADLLERKKGRVYRNLWLHSSASFPSSVLLQFESTRTPSFTTMFFHIVLNPKPRPLSAHPKPRQPPPPLYPPPRFTSSS